MILKSMQPFLALADSVQPTAGLARYVEVTIQYADGSVMHFCEGEVSEIGFRGTEHEVAINAGTATFTCSIPFNEVQ